MSISKQDQPGDRPSEPDRRKFLVGASGLAMGGALIGSYGTLAFYALRFLYPAKQENKRWMFVGVVSQLPDGEAIEYRTPQSATVMIARQGSSGTVDEFIALSDVCPHLGCKVHWEMHRNRFFCPCHNGVFNPRGEGIAGPPKGQSLERFELRVTDGLLYIQLPVAERTTALSSRGGPQRQVAVAPEARPGKDCRRSERRIV